MKAIHNTPCKSDYYTAIVKVVLDYGGKLGTIATNIFKRMYWNNTFGKWMVPDPYGKKCRDIDEYLTELNGDKDIPYKVIGFECHGYIDDNDYCGRESTATVNQVEPPRNNIKGTVNEVKNMLAELLVMMCDTGMQLYGTDIRPEKTGPMDGKCLEDDINIVADQARLALGMMGEIRRRLV